MRPCCARRSPQLKIRSENSERARAEKEFKDSDPPFLPRTTDYFYVVNCSLSIVAPAPPPLALLQHPTLMSRLFRDIFAHSKTCLRNQHLRHFLCVHVCVCMCACSRVRVRARARATHKSTR